jgi:hypothetical protein
MEYSASKDDSADTLSNRNVPMDTMYKIGVNAALGLEEKLFGG